MAKTTYRVQTPHGTITRTTARSYAYVVVARGQRHDRLTSRYATDVASYPRDIAYYAGKIANFEAGLADKYDAERIDRDRQAKAELEALLSGGRSDRLVAELAQSDADMVSPYDGKSGLWSSRLDLARRNFDDLAATYRDVRIFDVATGAQVLSSVDGVVVRADGQAVAR